MEIWNNQSLTQRERDLYHARVRGMQLQWNPSKAITIGPREFGCYRGVAHNSGVIQATPTREVGPKTAVWTTFLAEIVLFMALRLSQTLVDSYSSKRVDLAIHRTMRVAELAVIQGRFALKGIIWGIKTWPL